MQRRVALAALAVIMAVMRAILLLLLPELAQFMAVLEGKAAVELELLHRLQFIVPVADKMAEMALSVLFGLPTQL
ncbi:MAG: hypothetical protein EBR82_64900 [Caulobacteraceae bacterium]|nr:hypothetical protein [Caulobacteraceae bacterium]